MMQQVHCCVCGSEKEKAEWVFLFPFPENKEEKRKQWAGLNIPFFFFLTLIAPNSACL